MIDYQDALKNIQNYQINKVPFRTLEIKYSLKKLSCLVTHNIQSPICN